MSFARVHDILRSKDYADDHEARPDKWAILPVEKPKTIDFEQNYDKKIPEISRPVHGTIIDIV